MLKKLNLVPVIFELEVSACYEEINSIGVNIWGIFDSFTQQSICWLHVCFIIEIVCYFVLPESGDSNKAF